jgi:signal transduction histidine kinase
MSPPTPYFVVVDDDANTRALVTLVLRDAFPDSVVREVGDAIAFADHLGGEPPRGVVVRDRLRWSEGVQVIAALKRHHPTCVAALLTDEPYGDPGADACAPITPAGLVSLPGLVRDAEDRYRGEVNARDLEQFTYAVSHDLQDPLQLITQSGRLLVDRLRTEGPAETLVPVERMVDSAERMQDMLDGLLKYATVGTGRVRFEPVDLDAALREALRNLEGSMTANAVRVDAGRLPTVAGERRELTQLLQNLVGNAIKFHGDAPPVVTIRARELRDAFEVEVRDNGIGIEPGQEARIFRMFTRLEAAEGRRGVGVGLAICKRIVERHGGTIAARNNEGGGASFSFTIPMFRGPHADAQGG